MLNASEAPEGVARGTEEVDTKVMSTMEALQVGLAARDFQEENDLIEKGGFDYDVIGKIDTGIP
jgi:hypothetical protein